MNPGFLQNAAGEFSSTKLFNLLYGLVFLAMWAYLSFDQKKLLPLDPTTMIPIGVGQGLNSINKWIEANANTEKAKFIKAIMAKVVKK